MFAKVICGLQFIFAYCKSIDGAVRKREAKVPFVENLYPHLYVFFSLYATRYSDSIP